MEEGLPWKNGSGDDDDNVEEIDPRILMELEGTELTEHLLEYKGEKKRSPG